MSPVKYELGFYIQGDDILQRNRREHLKSAVAGFILGLNEYRALPA
jgi:hypothetical protein